MISIFAKPPFMMRHLQRVSSTVRGEQMAAYMGNARLNPPDGYENDVCIYVKPHIKPGNDYKFEKRSYVDIHEAISLVHILRKYPEVGVIALSELDVKTLSTYVENKIVLIPHHHLNFERARRDRKEITRVGITGSFGAFPHIPEAIRSGLKERNVELIEWSTFYPRTFVAGFHRTIDVHLHWRPWVRRKLSCPFKITNAAAFGVPTIANNEPSFKEVEGCYLGADSPEEWLEKFDELVDSPKLYKEMAKTCIEKSERYHISNIAKLYQKLT
jgi:hypothetical protein